MKPQSEKIKISSAKSYGLGVLILILSSFIATGLFLIFQGNLLKLDMLYSPFPFKDIPMAKVDLLLALGTIFSVFVASMVFRNSLQKTQNIRKVLIGSSIPAVIYIFLSITNNILYVTDNNTRDPLQPIPEGGGIPIFETLFRDLLIVLHLFIFLTTLYLCHRWITRKQNKTLPINS